MLTRVHVQGYKCLRDVALTLAPFTLFIGKTDSGKSAFLQAIAEPSRGLLRWHPTDVHEVSNGEWSVTLEGETGALAYDAPRYNKPRFQPKGGSVDALNFLGKRQAEIWFTRHHELVASDPVSLDPLQIAAHSPAALAALDPLVASRGAGTAAHLASLALGDRERFGAVESTVAEVTGGRVRSLVVKDVGSSTYTLAFKLHDGVVVPAAQMSQGLLLFVGLLALVQRATLPGVLLIEEPERGLDPQRLLQIIATLRALSERGVQVIVTTHSPDVIGACDPGEVRIFHRRHPESPTEVAALAEPGQKGDGGASLGHLWSARGEEGLLSLARTSPRLREP